RRIVSSRLLSARSPGIDHYRVLCRRRSVQTDLVDSGVEVAPEQRDDLAGRADARGRADPFVGQQASGVEHLVACKALLGGGGPRIPLNIGCWKYGAGAGSPSTGSSRNAFDSGGRS